MVPQLTGAVRIFVCTKPADMRKGFDGLSGMVQEFLGQDPLSGHLFLFFNNHGGRISGYQQRFRSFEWAAIGYLVPSPSIEAVYLSVLFSRRRYTGRQASCSSFDNARGECYRILPELSLGRSNLPWATTTLKKNAVPKPERHARVSEVSHRRNHAPTAAPP